MKAAFDATGPHTAGIAPADLRFLRIVLALQVVLGLLWGISMLFFAKQIVLGEEAGPHIEKIAMEGAAHMTLVLAAILVWRAPARSRDVLLLMVFLNGLWTLADLVYIPLVNLDELDFFVKVVVNAVHAIALAVAGWRAGILSREGISRTLWARDDA
jgi:hypothetical protein